MSDAANAVIERINAMSETPDHPDRVTDLLQLQSLCCEILVRIQPDPFPQKQGAPVSHPASLTICYLLGVPQWPDNATKGITLRFINEGFWTLFWSAVCGSPTPSKASSLLLDLVQAHVCRGAVLYQPPETVHPCASADWLCLRAAGYKCPGPGGCRFSAIASRCCPAFAFAGACPAVHPGAGYQFFDIDCPHLHVWPLEPPARLPNGRLLRVAVLYKRKSGADRINSPTADAVDHKKLTEVARILTRMATARVTRAAATQVLADKAASALADKGRLEFATTRANDILQAGRAKRARD